MITEITQERIDDYVVGVLCYPIRGTEHLVGRAMLHFPYLKEVDARYMVAVSLLKLAIKGVGR